MLHIWGAVKPFLLCQNSELARYIEGQDRDLVALRAGQRSSCAPADALTHWASQLRRWYRLADCVT